MNSKKAILWIIGVGVLLASTIGGWMLSAIQPDDAPQPLGWHHHDADHDELGAPRDPRWRELRDKFAAANPECWGCGRPTKEIHHDDPVAHNPSRELDETNLVPVCHECHFRICHAGNTRFYNPNCRADLKAYRKIIESRLPIKKKAA